MKKQKSFLINFYNDKAVHNKSGTSFEIESIEVVNNLLDNGWLIKDTKILGQTSIQGRNQNIGLAGTVLIILEHLK